MPADLDGETLRRLLAADAEVQLVDVRAPAGYRSGHIPGSENVPFERLLTSIDAVDWGDRVVFVCPYGERSRQAAELLSAYDGLDPDAEVYNLAGGLQAWDGPIVDAGPAGRE